jgi:D-alanyl-D-alanine carboxypeptidase/D-alanyl-D-alanine-endopeptidase (penicillin-binding protein 4)
MRRGVLAVGPVRALVVVLGIGLVGLIPLRHAPADIPGSVTLFASAPRVNYGEGVLLSGHVEAGADCSAGRTVQLQRMTAGTDTWEPVGSTTSGSDGGFSFSQSPPHTAGYQALVLSTDGDAGCSDIVSPTVTVAVGAAVTLTPASPSTAAGECAGLSVAVSPDKTGQNVVIQRHRDWGWQRIHTDTLRPGSVAPARPCFGWGDLGSVQLRARWPSQDPSNDAGLSTPITLQVVKSRWMREIDGLTAGIPMSVSVGEAGSYLYQRRDQIARTPASNEKLLLSMALFDGFGSQFKLPTRAMARTIRDGVIPGDLWIVGSGDPSVNRVRIKLLARTLVDAGVRRIRGSVRGSTTYFSRDWWAPGWKREFISEDIALPTALTFLGNEVRGKHITDPERRAAGSLTRALRRLGVRVRGGPGAGRSPSGLVEVARVDSPPLGALLRRMNFLSANFYAEVLGKRSGVARFGVPGTISKGAATTAGWVRAHDVPVTAYDGSGLSYWNRVTASGLVRLLGMAEEQPWGMDLRRSLPAPGQGTLRHRLSGVLVRAKTGTLTHISALSGWVWLEHRQAWAEFSILSAGLRVSTEKAIEDRIVRILFERGR